VSEATAQRNYAKAEEGFYVVNRDTDFAVARCTTYAAACREAARREAIMPETPGVLGVIQIVHPQTASAR
jgi:hypothetical protein